MDSLSNLARVPYHFVAIGLADETQRLTKFNPPQATPFQRWWLGGFPGRFKPLMIKTNVCTTARSILVHWSCSLIMGCRRLGGEKDRPTRKTSTESRRRETPQTIRLALPQAHPQGRWGSPSAAPRRREEPTPGEQSPCSARTEPWALT
jgi:hypothetical protein